MPKDKAARRRLRDSLLDKAGSKCTYCGCNICAVTLTVDHIIPRTKGGSNKSSNLVAACKSCNSTKCAGSIEDFRKAMQLKNSKFKGIINSNQLAKLSAIGVVGLDLPPYKFHFEGDQ